MRATALSSLHRAAFPNARAWSRSEFADLLARPETLLLAVADGFALGRIVTDEAELLTLAIHPTARRRGLGRHLLAEFEAGAAARGAVRAFLEVAADNLPALALYRQAGWRESGRRAGYYARPTLPPVDALVLQKPLVAGTDG